MNDFEKPKGEPGSPPVLHTPAEEALWAEIFSRTLAALLANNNPYAESMAQRYTDRAVCAIFERRQKIDYTTPPDEV